MKQLIVNADDFGLHPLINAGIIKGHQEGFITSTSLMPSAPCWQEAVRLAKENPRLGIPDYSRPSAAGARRIAESAASKRECSPSRS